MTEVIGIPLLRTVHAPARAVEADGWPLTERSLSARELDVLDLVASGYSDNEIAVRIGVSAATVNTHLRHVYAKLRARNRAHAVAIALRRGLLTRPGLPDRRVKRITRSRY